jgi:hypothetical protein
MNRSHRRGDNEWREIISTQPNSGLSIAAYCRQRGVSQPSFFLWRRRLGRTAAEVNPGAASFVELTAPGSAGLARASGIGLAAGIEVCLRGGRRLWVGSGFDRALLIEVVRALEAIA